MREGPESPRPMVPDTCGVHGVVRFPEEDLFSSQCGFESRVDYKIFSKVSSFKYLLYIYNKSIYYEKS